MNDRQRTLPNIIVFIADQLRYDALGCNGNQYVKTPHIDAIAADAVVFDNAYVCQPLCVPQRCSMLTGLYPSSHGSNCNGIPLDESLPVYPELLRQFGYQTFAAGKLHFAPISREFGPNPYEPGEVPNKMPYYGFEAVEFIEGEGSGYVRMLNHSGFPCKNPHDDLSYDHDGPFQTTIDHLPEALNRSTYVADKSLHFLQNRDQTKPFLMHCSFWDPHHPFVIPASFEDLYNPDEMPLPIPYSAEDFDNLPQHFKKFYERNWPEQGKSFAKHSTADWQRIIAHYYGMISLMDKNIGRIMAGLRENNLEQDTIIIFVSDHGELLGDHGLALKGTFHYEGTLKVPLMVNYPKQYKAGRVATRVMSYDIMPTILDFAGITIPKRITAKTLCPLLENPQAARADLVIIESPNTRTVIKGDFKLNYHLQNGDGQLYNLKDDPQETVNLWEDMVSVRAEMLAACLYGTVKTLKPRASRIGPW